MYFILGREPVLRSYSIRSLPANKLIFCRRWICCICICTIFASMQRNEHDEAKNGTKFKEENGESIPERRCKNYTP